LADRDNTARDGAGKWRKGVSGNPGGRPAGYSEFVAAARAEGAASLAELIRLRDQSEHDAVRVSACREILDRGFGKPAQAVQLTGSDGGPVQTEIVIKKLFVPVADDGKPC